MQVAYVVPDLTHLRYYVPFSKRLYKYFPDITQTFFLCRDNIKYNGLRDKGNFEIVNRLLRENCPYAIATTDPEQVEFDVVVQVEVGARLNAKKRIAIQHGFDYAFKSSELNSQVDAYVCSSAVTCIDALARGITSSLVAPVPVCLWDVNLDLIPKAPERSVTVFYPDVGDNDIAKSVVECLADENFTVFVKQRRKHQAIQCGGHHVYDSVWYPTESLVLPLTTDVTIGFGSTAYTDLVVAGVDYINVDIRSTEAPWNAFRHPSDKNYFRITERDGLIEAVKNRIMTSSRITHFTIDDEQLRTFILELIND